MVVGHERVDDEAGVVVRPSAAPAALLHRQDSAERVPEVRVEDGVDDRVEGRVGVAEPGQDLEGERRDALLADAVDHVHDEEGSPESVCEEVIRILFKRFSVLSFHVGEKIDQAQ